MYLMVTLDHAALEDWGQWGRGEQRKLGWVRYEILLPKW